MWPYGDMQLALTTSHSWQDGPSVVVLITGRMHKSCAGCHITYATASWLCMRVSQLTLAVLAWPYATHGL